MIPVVLSGGSGTRLWPVSRAAFPKQFNDLVGEPLLAQTLRRLSPIGTPWVVAVQATETLTRTVLRDLEIPKDHALFEPVGRNTAPAVALLCHVLRARGLGDEVVGIFPADHLITREATFQDATRLAEDCARRGRVVTLGIHPNHPATGYGYIEVTDEIVGHVEDGNPEGLDALGCAGFHEKPDAERAQRFVESGCFYWNSGMFVFRVNDMAAHFANLMPELWQGVQEIKGDLSNLAEVYQGLPSESLDYGVMEKLSPDQLACIPCAPGWSDLGSWDEVARRRSQHRDVYQEAGDGNFVYGHRNKVYGFVGVSDLVLVDTDDATMVAARGHTESVKGLVDKVRDSGHKSTEEHTFEKRPWGEFEVLRDTEYFKSKILRVAPNQRLSYQSHRHRSEHWVIVKGHPEVVLDGETLTPQPGESVYIPQGAKHRIVNPTDAWVELVEVQVGTYFGEDDIIRYEDDYARA